MEANNIIFLSDSDKFLKLESCEIFCITFKECFIISKLCVYSDEYLSYYNRNNSEDFNYTSQYKGTDPDFDFNNDASTAIDIIYTYKDIKLNNETQLKNVAFYLGTDTNDKLCGTIGFEKDDLICERIINFTSYLKKQRYINNYKFIRKVNVLITIEEPKNYDEIFAFMSVENSGLNFKYKILNLKFLRSSIYIPHVSLLYFRLGNYIDPGIFEKYNRVFYTVPSEDELDDIHMVYESGNEKKEFKFTNLPERPIVPVEEANKINQENIKPKKNFFSLPSFISKFFKKNYQEKNNNDFLNEEQKKLKVD